MARPKKIKVEDIAETLKPINTPVFKRQLRDEDGLIKGLEYKFKPTGFVDWRAMIPREHLALNREVFLRRDSEKDVETLSDEEYQKLLSNATEKEVLIKLAGLKEIALIRGYSNVDTHIQWNNEESVVATTRISWIPNFEHPYEVVGTGTADATVGNTRNVSSRHLVAIAENRAFARAVRNFLQIHTVSQDEVKYENPDFVKGSSSGPQAVLEKKLKDLKVSFTEFHQFLIENHADSYAQLEIWETPSDIKSSDVQTILAKYIPLFAEFLKKK